MLINNFIALSMWEYNHISCWTLYYFAYLFSYFCYFDIILNNALLFQVYLVSQSTSRLTLQQNNSIYFFGDFLVDFTISIFSFFRRYIPLLLWLINNLEHLFWIDWANNRVKISLLRKLTIWKVFNKIWNIFVNSALNKCSSTKILHSLGQLYLKSYKASNT